MPARERVGRMRVRWRSGSLGRTPTSIGLRQERESTRAWRPVATIAFVVACATLLPSCRLTSIAGIAIGWEHGCALSTTGGVTCWGYNQFGQLGDGTLVSRRAAGPAAVEGAIQVVAGELHTCALLGDGTIRCWGRNANGQLGDGTTTDSPNPVTVTDITDATEISGGLHHTLSLIHI